MRHLISASVSVLLALSLAMTPALGQHAHTPTLSLPKTVSASEMDATAQLYTEIETIYAVYETKLIEANTADEKFALKAHRAQEIGDAIKAASLSAKRYQAILERANEDADVRKRLNKRIRTARGQHGTTVQKTLTGSSQKQQCSPDKPKANTK